MTVEFTEAFSGRFFGKYRGVVLDAADPKELYRLRVTVPSLTRGKMIPLGGWAWPYGIVSGLGWGSTPPLPEKGAWVWVEFEEGDKNRPLWTYGPWGLKPKAALEPNTEEGIYVDNNGEASAPAPEELVNMVPSHARGEMDDSDMGMHGVGNVPKSHFRGEYGKVWVWESPAGQLIEIDDTKGSERIQIQHLSGALIEILPDGTIVEGATGNLTHQAGGDAKLQAGGNVHIKAGANTIIEAGKKMIFLSNQQVENKDPFEALGDGETPIEFVFDNIKYKVRKVEHEIAGDERRAIGGGLYVAIDANEERMVGGARQIQVARNETKMVMESGEHVFAGATNLDPVSATFLRRVYNGLDLELQTDPTGTLVGSHHVKGHKPPFQRLWTGAGNAALLARVLGPLAPGIGSQLHLDGTGAATTFSSMLNLLLVAIASISMTAPLIFLGGPAAIEPALMGLKAQTVYDSHTHLTPAGMSGPPSSGVPAGATMAPAQSTVVFILR